MISIFSSNLLYASIFDAFASAPKCSDEDSIQLIKKTYENKYLKQFKKNYPERFKKLNFPKSIKSLHNIRTTNYNKNIELRNCIAIVVFKNGMQSNIKYKLQLDETNKDNFYLNIDNNFYFNVINTISPQHNKGTSQDNLPAPVMQKNKKVVPKNNDSLHMIAEKLKSESKAASTKVNKLKSVEEKKHVEKDKHENKEHVKSGIYVQIGSFRKYKPNKNYLNKIKDNGYKYIFKKDSRISHILIGPFKNAKEAHVALRKIRKNIEAGAFVYRVE